MDAQALDHAATAFARLLDQPEVSVDAAYERARRLSDGLFPHQVEGVAFLLGRRHAILADDMGLGKTRQAIVALGHAAPTGPRLVICPASLKSNWAREVRLVEPDAGVEILPAPVARPGAARWTIVNYDILATQAARLRGVPWAGLVVDEAHYIKNHKSARSRLVREIAAAAPQPIAARRVVYALTGTPLTNRPRDLFTLLQLVEHPLGRSFLSFAKRYCDAVQNDYGWVTDGASNLEELAVQLHGVMLRRTKDEVLALPPKIRGWVPVPVPPDTGAAELAKAVRLLVERVRLSPRRPEEGEGEEGGSPAVPLPEPAAGPAARPGSRANDRTRLLAHLTAARRQLAAAKVSATQEMVEDALEQGEKVIVFSCFDEPIARLARHFGRTAVVLTGKTPSARRQAVVDVFQSDPDVRVFLANIIAGGTGITLTAARQVVFNDLDWVPANHWQAEDRAYRIGQTGVVNVTYLFAEDTIDTYVQQLLSAKAALVDAVVDGRALDGEALGDVLGELERALTRLAPRLTDAWQRDLDDELIRQMLRDAAAAAASAAAPVAGASARAPLDPAMAEQALLALARVLRGSDDRRYRAASSSQPGAFYTITVGEGSDVTCSCPGYEYRGTCRHSREVKAAVAKGAPVPAGYEPAP